MADPYQILGVARTASAGDLKSAYRKLAKKLHPDVNPGRKDIEQQFKEVTAAYDLLSDSTKRAKFDRAKSMRKDRNAALAAAAAVLAAAMVAARGAMQLTVAVAVAAKPAATRFRPFGRMDDIFSEFMGGMRNGGRKSGSQGSMRRRRSKLFDQCQF